MKLYTQTNQDCKYFKFEGRNPKYETNSNDQNSNVQNSPCFGHLDLEFRISIFGFSDFRIFGIRFLYWAFESSEVSKKSIDFNKIIWYYIKKMSVSTKYWLLAGIYMGLIFIVSSIPGESLPEMPTSDKLIHVIEFGILSWILGKAFRTSQKKFFIKQAAIFSIIITIFYGISDEIHQFFIHARTPDIYDVCFDGIGAILAQGVFLRTRKREKQNE